MDDAKAAEETGKILEETCTKVADENVDAKYVLENKDMLIKPSMWIFGGDGCYIYIAVSHSNLG